MALTEETYIDKAELLVDGQIQVREKRVIMDGGKEVASKFHRYVLDPARDDEKSVSEKVKGKDKKIDVLAMVKSVWTKEKVKARKDFVKNQAESHRA